MLLVVLLLTCAGASAQEAHKPYAGQEAREIKALPAEEVESLLNGEGAGMAKAAELNHYPGPKHVLELADKLKLSDAQAAGVREAFGRMRAEALRLGRLVVEREREFDQLFARREIDAGKLQTLSREIGLLRADLRVAHLRAHLETRALLTPEQVKLYDELRGYNAPGHPVQNHDRHGQR
jgi:Spy/CpxP family protein refolding chaperone